MKKKSLKKMIKKSFSPFGCNDFLILYNVKKNTFDFFGRSGKFFLSVPCFYDTLDSLECQEFLNSLLSSFFDFLQDEEVKKLSDYLGFNTFPDYDFEYPRLPNGVFAYNPSSYK